jgi:hypothetical protein
MIINEYKNTKFWFGKVERKTSFENLTNRCEEDVQINLKEVRRKAEDCIHEAVVRTGGGLL